MKNVKDSEAHSVHKKVNSFLRNTERNWLKNHFRPGILWLIMRLLYSLRLRLFICFWHTPRRPIYRFLKKRNLTKKNILTSSIKNEDVKKALSHYHHCTHYHQTQCQQVTMPPKTLSEPCVIVFYVGNLQKVHTKSFDASAKVCCH